MLHAIGILLIPAALIIVCLWWDAIGEIATWLAGLWIVLSFLALYVLVFGALSLLFFNNAWLFPVGWAVVCGALFAAVSLSMAIEKRINNSGAFGV